jgi:pimeloyl-ACP methyl ester carboxylesterase
MMNFGYYNNVIDDQQICKDTLDRCIYDDWEDHWDRLVRDLGSPLPYNNCEDCIGCLSTQGCKGWCEDTQQCFDGTFSGPFIGSCNNWVWTPPCSSSPSTPESMSSEDGSGTSNTQASSGQCTNCAIATEFTFNAGSMVLKGYRVMLPCQPPCNEDPTTVPTTPVIAFSGNGGTARTPWGDMAVVPYALFPNVLFPYLDMGRFEVFSASYPGYPPNDLNGEEPSESSLTEAAIGLYRYVTAEYGGGKYRNTRPILMGHSLGTAVSLATAVAVPQRLPQSPQPACVILSNPFTTAYETASVLAEQSDKWSTKVAFALYGYIIDEWPSIERAASYTGPLLVGSVLNDQLIPASQHRAVYEAAGAAADRKLFMSATWPGLASEAHDLGFFVPSKAEYRNSTEAFLFSPSLCNAIRTS